MAFLFNLVGYQLVWFALMRSVQSGLAIWGMLAAAVFVAITLAGSRWRGTDLRLLLITTIVGMCFDGAFAASGLLHYTAASPTFPPGGAPAWILALWATFSTTLTRSLGSLRGRPWLAASLGASFGPLAYWSAGRGFSALAWPPAHSALVFALLSLGWALVLAVLATLAERWQPRTREVRLIGEHSP